MLLAVLQAQAQVLDSDANLAILEDAAGRAALAGADVLLTPELFPVGYAPRRLRSELDPASLPVLHDHLARIAIQHSIAIVYSLPDVQGGRWNITSTFVDEVGIVRGAYVKVHLFGAGENESVSTILVPARALESQLYVAYANHIGVEDGFALGGGSVIADPFGQILAMGGQEEQLLFARVEPQALEKARAEIPYLTERRTDLYRGWGL